MNCGSSPRTRGTSRENFSRYLRRRFIPAHAGNITTSSFPAIIGHGSSPRTRGTSFFHQCRMSDGRFIPAHAGNILFSPVSDVRRAVHPRARGEHPIFGPPRSANVGSSPRTRGTSDLHRGNRKQGRFIPAHAGNIYVHTRGRGTIPWFIPAHAGNIHPVDRFSLSRPVHPRARGEHALCG